MRDVLKGVYFYSNPGECKLHDPGDSDLVDPNLVEPDGVTALEAHFRHSMRRNGSCVMVNSVISV